ncbi:hypothetical protein WUBG_11348 [Wuchereria bancrofti]|uniref:Uncharacterized protein n=1 Tax=Wuchereria bancrofti TaxID=6293 RepID=J9E627_WUCBA|nr:hypothetical protein WUBG_11348 [Wuchereria bancrofti]
MDISGCIRGSLIDVAVVGVNNWAVVGVDNCWNAQQHQMLTNTRNAATLAEKLPGLQRQTCQFINATETDHSSGAGETDLNFCDISSS